MPTYQYTARDVSGKMVAGEISTSTRFEALSQLHARGLVVMEITDHAIQAAVTNHNTMWTSFKRWSLSSITLSEKSVFCRQLSISVGSGVPLREALETIAEDMDNRAYQEVLFRILKRLDDGLPFSQAIVNELKAFDPLFVALIKTAEESGSMTETLDYLAVSLEKNDRLARKIKSVIAYPIFVACFFVIVSMIMTLFVLPRFQSIFSSTGGNLPRLTQIVFMVNGFIISNTVWIFSGFFVLMTVGVMYGRTVVGRCHIDRLMLRLPVVGDIIRKIAVARFCRNLGIMLHGGVPVGTAIEIASEVLGNKSMEKTLRQTRDRIMAGNDIATSLDRQVFPRLVVRMVGVGESSGKLPEVLVKVADVYEDQAEGAIMIAMALIEPIIIVVFGCMILVLVMAVYLPVFTAAGHIR
ncbi:MAG: type II secretion system F family protein [bacterium]